MKFNVITLALITLGSSNQLYSQSSKANIFIAEQTERYEFIKGDKNSPVHIKESVGVRYKCNELRGAVPFVAFYDDQSRIDEASVKVSGKKVKDLKTVDAYYSQDDIFYSDARVFTFSVPLEKTGSESEVSFQKTILDPKYFTTIYFPESLPVETKKIEIIVPTWMKVDIREMNLPVAGVFKTDITEKNKRIISYEIKNIKARKQFPGEPGPSYIYPHLLVLSKEAELETGPIKYFANTADQYNWYKSLVKDLSVSSPAINKKSQDITGNSTDVLQKMKKILHWVQDNIRYIAFENGIAGFKPMEAEQVLAKRYGDCKGMANLTRCLLKAADIDARLCWIGTNYIAYDYSTPSLSVDNHMICAVKLNGKTYFLDATETYIGFDEYAERIQGRQVLIENGNSFLLERVPMKDHEQNIMKETAIVEIDGNSLKGKNNIIWKGESKSSLLSFMHNAPKNEQESALLTYLSENKKGYGISDLIKPELNDWSGDLSAKYDFEWKDFASSFDKEIYFEPDFRREFENAIIDTTDRNAAYEFSYKYCIDQQTTFKLPAGYVPKSLPAPLSIERDAYVIRINTIRKNSNLIYEKKIWFTKPRIASGEIAQWNKDVTSLKNQYNEQIVLAHQ